MKLYLASYLQQSNFGPGKLISITSSSKPKNLIVKELYLPFTPSQSLLDHYNDQKVAVPDKAGSEFREAYRAQCESFVNEVLEAAKEENKTPQELLPFQEGDTLCSWERAEYTHYRKILAPFLEKLGYEVVSN